MSNGDAEYIKAFKTMAEKLASEEPVTMRLGWVWQWPGYLPSANRVHVRRVRRCHYHPETGPDDE